MSKGKVGRPAVYKSNDIRKIVSAARRLGLSGARQALSETYPNISLPTIAKFAKNAGLEFKVGRRPAGKVAKEQAA